MSRSLLPRGLTLTGGAPLGVVLSTPLLAHDDDPKVLARRLPNNGPGYQAPAFAADWLPPPEPVDSTLGVLNSVPRPKRSATTVENG